ncbi:MAG: type II secretion system F family protein [Candidatus Aenigmarchaeota archaeon]|nr:type II secretion system F family protein [Candidatus Aenigmarchaeota archaeon]
MDFYTKFSFRFFGGLSDDLAVFFPDLADDLKKAGLSISNKEYISLGAMSSFLFLLMELPIVSFIFGFVFKGVLISLITSITTSVLLALLVFYLFTQYPKTVVHDKEKRIDSVLPFASLFLSTIAGTKLPLDQIFKVFGRYSKYGEITNQMQLLNKDIDLFGMDIHTALERAVNRSPSKKLKEMLWGILSTSTSGGDVSTYLREKGLGQMEDYKRTLNDFSKKLTLFIEIYLTAIVVGAIFFIIMTSIFSGISGVGGNIILLQSLILFLFLPVISIVFMILIKVSSPTGD